MLTILLSALSGASLAFLVLYTAHRRTTNALPPPINPMVREILVLIETDFANWKFETNKGSKDGSFPHWWYKKDTDDSIGISMENDYQTFRRIWYPFPTNLTSYEKGLLKAAFQENMAGKIAKRTTYLLTDGSDD